MQKDNATSLKNIEEYSDKVEEQEKHLHNKKVLDAQKHFTENSDTLSKMRDKFQTEFLSTQKLTEKEFIDF